MDGFEMDEGEETASGRDAVALVILESGALWPARTSELQATLSRTLVESQVTGEEPTAFAARVAARIARLERRGASVHLAVLSCSTDYDAETARARAELARALVDSMVRWNVGELVIAGQDGAPEPAKQSLFELAGGACQNLAGSRVAVHVRFSREEASGLRSAQPSPLADTA